jgi:uncharacterized protein YkwD
MVNKFTVIAVAIVAGSALGVGAFVGSQLPADSDEATTETSTPDPTPTPTATGIEEVTASNGTPSPTATARPTVAAERFDAATIETEVLAAINAERRDRDLDELGTDDPLRPMARFHSDNMAGQGYVSQAAGGYTTKERYEEYEQADRCKIVNDGGGGIVTKRNMEAVGSTKAGRYMESDDGREINRNESAVARDVVDSWFEKDDSAGTLTLNNAARAGVGVTVTDEGRVYVTVDLC